MKHRKFPHKLTVLGLLIIYVMCLSLTFPETNAHLKVAEVEPVATPIGDLEVSLLDPNTNLVIPSNGLLERLVSVSNQGDFPVMVRASLHPVLTGLKEELLPVEASLFFRMADDWLKGNDGFWYYMGILEPGPTQPNVPLFTGLRFDTLPNERKQLTTYLKIEAVTALGNAYREAWWQGIKPPNNPGNTALYSIDKYLTTLQQDRNN